MISHNIHFEQYMKLKLQYRNKYKIITKMRFSNYKIPTKGFYKQFSYRIINIINCTQYF